MELQKENQSGNLDLTVSSIQVVTKAAGLEVIKGKRLEQEKKGKG